MKVLVACEYSGIIREAFRCSGHDAWSCDLLPTEIQGQHYQGDIFDILNNFEIIGGKPDIMIAHPDCTYLANSGVRWLYKYPDRWNKMLYASWFFKQLYNQDMKKICIENPVPHRYGQLPKYTQIVHPYMFGHLERKATCLWLKGLPNLVETNNIKADTLELPKKEQQKIHWMAPSPDRGHERSRTYRGITEAIASQWG